MQEQDSLCKLNVVVNVHRLGPEATMYRPDVHRTP